MLISASEEQLHPSFSLFCDKPTTITHKEGVYEIEHFSAFPGLPFRQMYPVLDGFDSYGVCDNFQQVLDQCPMIEEDTDRKFVVTVTPIRRAEQSEDGGWRWHKWGPYIGTQEPTTEYLYDEPLIDLVYVYHVYEPEISRA